MATSWCLWREGIAHERQAEAVLSPDHQGPWGGRMKLRLWLPDGPVTVGDDPTWSCLWTDHRRPACFVAIDAGVDIPQDTYTRADPEVSQYQWTSWNEKGLRIGDNDTALLPLEVDE